MKLLATLFCLLTGILQAATPPTNVTIVGEDFHLNGRPTYAGRTWQGHRMEGLLLNSRMVQATFDDRNPETAKRWAYADTGKWDAERNVREFISALPAWKARGLLAVTVNFQGGSPEGYSSTQPWITGAFDEDGALRSDATARMKRVLDAADANGMVVILGYFYFGQDQRLKDEAAVIRATDEATRWLLDGGWRNVLVEVTNETNGKSYDHEILRPARIHELLERVRRSERDGRHLLVGTSYGGGVIPRENVVRASDFLLLHGNGVKDPARITAMIEQTRAVPGYRPMPILFNEDDHEAFDQPANNCAAAIASHVSWGWFDFRRKGEALEEGYQSPPVNWGISSPRKRAFFDYVGEITGAAAALAVPQPRAVHIKIDAAHPSGPLKPIWRFFGADEPNYAYMQHGRELLGELGSLQKNNVFFRTHSLLVTGKGEHSLKWGSTNAYTENAAGNPIYDWTIVDRIFDSYRSNGVRPYVQIGFMPQALSTKPDPYRHHFPQAPYKELFGGWACPPKDFGKWEELVFQWAKHCVERYGEAEVLHWYWETWNEPNADYWQGTRQEFFKLHDHAVRAVRRAIPSAKVGGPDLAAGAGGDFLESFLNHCLKGTNLASGERGTPLDFISFHAKGSPKQIDGHVRMGISNQLREIDDAFGAMAKYPELKATPIVIGESDPDGCAACTGPDRAYRNSTLYSSYTAASFPRKLDLAEAHGVNLEGALTWSFEFEDQPYFAGFRSLATNGIDKPVLNVFRMFSRMDGERLRVESDGAVPLDVMLKAGVRENSDVSALAARAGKRITVLVWHYHDDDVAGADAAVTLELENTPAGSPQITRTLIDKAHSNAFTAWQAMGSPQTPTEDQIRVLKAAGQLAPATEKTEVKSADGNCTLAFSLARQGVTLVELQWP